MTTALPQSPEPDVLEQASAWCLRLSQGELATSEQAAFESWLDTDPAHRPAFDDAVQIWRAIDEAALSPDLIALRRAALDNYRKANQSRWAGPPFRWRIAGGIAATLVAAVLAVAVWVNGTQQDYSTGVGERRVIALSDGSKISLDAATEVDVHYSRNRRELHLVRGRAKFSVAKDPARPFTVAVADKVVVATGTEFSVETLGNAVHVILYEGHVAVLSKGGQDRLGAPLVASPASPRAADTMLTPGRELITPISVSTAQVVAADLGRSISWEAGQIVFVDEPLATAVERINRYSDQKVAVGDAAAGAMRVNGVFTAGDTRAFVEGATGILPLKAQASGDRTILISTR